jgi:hypothetical protein
MACAARQTHAGVEFRLTYVSLKSFTSVRVCLPSGHCGHEFLRQDRDGPSADVALQNNYLTHEAKTPLARVSRFRGFVDLMTSKE